MQTTQKHFLIIFATVLISCTSKTYKQPTVKIKTNYGDIIVELYPEKAPKTVPAFLYYVDSGYIKTVRSFVF